MAAPSSSAAFPSDRTPEDRRESYDLPLLLID